MWSDLKWFDFHFTTNAPESAAMFSFDLCKFANSSLLLLALPDQYDEAWSFILLSHSNASFPSTRVRVVTCTVLQLQDCISLPLYCNALWQPKTNHRTCMMISGVEDNRWKTATGAGQAGVTSCAAVWALSLGTRHTHSAYPSPTKTNLVNCVLAQGQEQQAVDRVQLHSKT